MALGALTLARSRAQEKKLLPAITFTGERFVESGNDHASDTEVLVVALLVILFEPSPYETQQRAAQSGPVGDGAAPAGSGRSWAPGRLFPAASHAPRRSP